MWNGPVNNWCGASTAFLAGVVVFIITEIYFRGAVEKVVHYEYNPKLADHADQYLGRIRNFLNSLLQWGVSWNIALLGTGTYYLVQYHQNPNSGDIWLARSSTCGLFILNLFIFVIYRYQRQVSEVVKEFVPRLVEERGVIVKAMLTLWIIIEFVTLTIFSLSWL